MKRAGILIAIAMVLCGAWMGWAGFSGNGGGYVPSPVGQSGKVPVSNGTTYDMTTLSSLGGGDVIGPATNSDGYIPQWNGADSKTLKNGLSVGAGLSIGASSIVVDIHGVTEETTPASDDEILIYDTSESALRRMTRGNFVSGLGVGGSTILDLGDNGVNESTAIGEIATLNDTNSIFTEPAADKLLIDVSKKWPATNAADALAANGANCSAGQFPLGVDAAGAVESCTALPTTIAGTTNQIAASASTGAITLSIPNSPTLPGTTTGSFSGPLTGNVTGNVSGTAGSLAANGANCSSGYAPLGVDASGAVESCFQVQPYDAELLAVAGLTSAADRLPYFTGSGTASLATFTSFARTLMDDTNSTDAQTTLALVPGTNVQAQNANLQAIAGLTSSANVMPYFTGSGTAATTSLSAFGRTLIDDADASTALSTLTAAGLAASNTFTGNNVFGNGDTDTLTIQSMIIGGNSRAVQIADSLASPTYATGTNELYVAGDIETPANIHAGSISTGSGTDGSRRIDINSNTAFTCSGNQLYFLNNAFYVCENGTAKDVPMATDSITWSGATFSLAGVTNLTLPTAAPDATGEVGGWEANGWGTSHGSYKIYDGTSAVRIVATTATDSPSNGQVPKWNTGGTITWEDDNSAGTPSLNSITDPTGDTTLTLDVGEEISLQYTGNFTTGSQFLIQQQTGDPSGGTLFEVRGTDGDPVLAKFGDGTNGIQITPGGAMTATANGSITATLLSPVDSTDTTTWVAIFDTQTGSQAIKTDGGLAYNASTGVLSATGFSGPLTGNVTGNCSGSAATLTGTLANVASSTLANLATVLSDEGTGVITAMGSATNGASGIVTLAASPGTPDGTKFLRDDRTWQAVLSNPMTTQYDLIYGGASGTPTRVATSSGFITAIQSALNGAGGLITYGNAAGTAAVLTGLSAASGALSESDTILQGLGKLVYQLSLSDNQVLGQYGGTKGGLAIDGDLASVSTNHDTLPSAKATKDAMDARILPPTDDPDTSVNGVLAVDTDGWIRATFDSGTSQRAVGRAQEEIHVTVYKPNDLDDAQRDHFWVWSNESGMSFVVTGWKAWSTSDDTTLAIMEEDADGQNDATVDAVEIATNGTGLYYASDTTITAATVENGHLLYLNFDDTDAPAMVKVTIYGYYDANVN